MGELAKLMTGNPIGALIGWIAATFAAGAWLLQHLEKYRTLRNTVDDYHKTVKKNVEDIKKLQEDVDMNSEHFKKLEKQDGDIMDKLDEAIAAIREMREYNRKRDLADTKNSIRHSYYTYHARGAITEKEKESLEDLIASYENSGGENSFVHTTVVPEMSQWKVITDEQLMIINNKL